MKKLIVNTVSIASILIALTGCSSTGSITQQDIFAEDLACKGFKAKDPQFCKGEQWQQIPNFEHEAIYLYDAGLRW
jgi:uncharacterized protein YcfL